VDTVLVILNRDLRQVLEADVAFAHQSLSPQCEVAGRGREPRFLAPGFEERRADHPARHLLEPEYQNAVVSPHRDVSCRQSERGAAAGAAGFDVDDRNAG
jgi:hypothetical protein